MRNAKGPSVVIVSPFSDNFWYLTVPYGIGKDVLEELLKIGAFSTPEQMASLSGPEMMELERDKEWREWRKLQWELAQQPALDHFDVASQRFIYDGEVLRL